MTALLWVVFLQQFSTDRSWLGCGDVIFVEVAHGDDVGSGGVACVCMWFVAEVLSEQAILGVGLVWNSSENSSGTTENLRSFRPLPHTR